MSNFQWQDYLNAQRAPGAGPLLVRIQRRPGWVWKVPAVLATLIMAPALLMLLAAAVVAILVFLVSFVLLGYLSDLLRLVGLGPRRRPLPAGGPDMDANAGAGSGGGADGGRPTVHIKARVIDGE